MGILPTVLLILGAVLRPASLGVPAPAHWRLFESRTQHFSVRYPPSWNRLETWDGVANADMLDIINFPNSERLQGVVIKKGGAEIWVGGPPEGIVSVHQWIHRYLGPNVIVDQRAVPVPSPSPGGCATFDRVVTRVKMDAAYEIDTTYYCSLESRLYGISLTNWEGDPHQSKLQGIALKIAVSLRSR